MLGMGKKKGSSGGGGYDDGASGPNKGLILAAWLLSTAGFGILLGGVAAMQSDCGSSYPGLATSFVDGMFPVGGMVGYLAPVVCGHFLQYAWWITFLHFFTWLLVLIYLAMNIVHRTRTALVGILAVAAVLLMDTANTFLMYNYLSGLSSTMATRTKVTVAGAAIAAIADLLLILIIGYESTRRNDERPAGEGTAYAAGVAPVVPGATTTTTTTTTAEGRVPVSTAV